MSYRFASCGSSSRSPTPSRGTTVAYPFWTRSTAVARTHPLVVAPQRITESIPRAASRAVRFVPKKAEAPFLTTTGSSSLRPSRGSSSTQGPPNFRSASPGIFCGQIPASDSDSSYPTVVKITGSPRSRARSSSRLVAVTSAPSSEPTLQAGSVNPREKSTTRTPGCEPSPTEPDSAAMFGQEPAGLGEEAVQIVPRDHVARPRDAGDLERGVRVVNLLRAFGRDGRALPPVHEQDWGLQRAQILEEVLGVEVQPRLAHGGLVAGRKPFRP